LNHIVAYAVQVFRDQVEVQLPDNIHNMISMLGLIQEDNNAFLQVIELAGNRVEKIKRYAKARNFEEVKPSKNTTEHEDEKVINKNKNI
jgi:hypothetical protein